MRKHNREVEEIDPVGQLVETKKINYIYVKGELPQFQNNTTITDPENTKAIKKVERMIRSSFEYYNYFSYLKQNLDMRRCSYLPNLVSGLFKMRIELHHSPFTMYDITATVVNKHIKEHGYALEFDIASEVMELHYTNMVGLIPVSPTIHELIHNQCMDVNPNLVYGFWRNFALQYQDFLTPDAYEKWQLALKWDGVPTTRMPEFLQVKYTFLNYEGLPLYQPKQIEDMTSLKNEIKI